MLDDYLVLVNFYHIKDDFTWVTSNINAPNTKSCRVKLWNIHSCCSNKRFFQLSLLWICERNILNWVYHIIEPINHKLPQIIWNHYGFHLLFPCIIILSIEGRWLLPYLSYISCHIKYPKKKQMP